MNDLQRDFKGVWIPKEIWFDDKINALDKIILTEIDSLDIGEEGCYASNEYLAEFCQCTVTKISTAISKLIDLGYVEVIKFDGRKRHLKVLKADFKKPIRQTLKYLKADFKKIKDINIYNNKDDKIKDNIIYIIDYLNEKAKTNYKATTNKTRSLILARINEGFTKDDFKKVIDNKTKEWLGTDMEKYLRPETLFGTKFEGYLNQKRNIPSWFDDDIKKEEVEISDEEKEYFGIK